MLLVTKVTPVQFKTRNPKWDDSEAAMERSRPQEKLSR